MIESHSEQTLKFSQKDGANIKVKNFKIIPEICRQQGRSITVNKTRETIHISRCNTVAKDSPCGKVSKPTDNDSRCNTVAKDSPCDKVSKPTDNDSRCNTVAKDNPCDKVSKPTDNDSFDDFEVDKSEDLSLLVDDKDEEYTEIVSLIPTVIVELKRAGKLTEFID